MLTCNKDIQKVSLNKFYCDAVHSVLLVLLIHIENQFFKSILNLRGETLKIKCLIIEKIMGITCILSP